VIAAVAVVVAQVLAWNGWNRSGQWVAVVGIEAIFSYATYGLVCASPMVLALWLCRSWVSLGVIATAVVAWGWQAGATFETSTSSTAAFEWFTPLVVGVPLVLLVAFLDHLASRRR
jgi:hypothetical protein